MNERKWEYVHGKIRWSFTDEEVTARAREMFPYWGGDWRGYQSFEMLEKGRAAAVAAGTALLANEAGWDLFAAAFMTLCLEKQYVTEDKLELVKWRKRADNFFNPAPAGWKTPR